MKYEPLPPRKKAPPPVAVVVDAGPSRLTVITQDGEMIQYAGRGGQEGRDRCYDILANLKGWTLYTTARQTSLLTAPGAERWQGWLWRHALVKLKLDGGPTVYPLRRALDGLAPTVAAGGLFAALEWLAGFGVDPGGLGAMAGRLWRASLPRPVTLYGLPHREPMFGGRQEAPWPAKYTALKYWDLSAAYPTAMAAQGYPSRIREVAGVTGAPPEGVGYSEALVRVPPCAWGPLPVRLGPGAVCYVNDSEGEWMQGTWTWRDLRLAWDHGCEVQLLRSWAGMGDVDLFGPWWEMVRPGRKLPQEGASRVVKAVTSTTWGRFAMSGERARQVRWLDHEGRQCVTVADPHTVRNGWACYVAAETTARVRERLYRETLVAPASTAVYCDTDGVLTGAASAAPASLDWTLKAHMTTCEIKGPQCYRWECDGCNDQHARWHYCVAGAVDEGAASMVFRRAGRRGAGLLAVAGHDDVTFPATTYRRALALMGRPGGRISPDSDISSPSENGLSSSTVTTKASSDAMAAPGERVA